MPSFPDNPVDLMRTRVVVEKERVLHPSSMDFPGNFPGQDHSWSLEKFKDTFKIVISELSHDFMEFDLIGVDASVANAFRRILISEIPTVAIEKVFFYNNTSVMHDEIMAHRLGLIPIKVNPDDFEYRGSADEHPTDRNTIVFYLNVKCSYNEQAPADAVEPSVKYVNSSIYSRQLVYQPQGDQEARYTTPETYPQAVLPDILIAKLRPGQEIDCELHCHKGIGKDHAKFSPVATASYRLLPEINIKYPITGDDAEKFRECFPEGVIEVVKGRDGVKKAVVANPRKDTVSRECLRHAEFENKVILSRVRDHFIFNIESTGILPSHDLFRRSVRALMEKCKKLKSSIEEMQAGGDGMYGVESEGR